jgi:hypothetical protein
MKKMTLANDVFESRCLYYKMLLDERQSIGSLNIQTPNEKLGLPFQYLTNICTKNGFKSVAVTHQLNLLEQQNTMKGDEMIVVCLKANGCYLCITRHFILSPILMNPLPFSKEVLDHFSYGTYIGIKRGVYICTRIDNSDFIIRFKKPFNHTVFKVGYNN